MNNGRDSGIAPGFQSRSAEGSIPSTTFNMQESSLLLKGDNHALNAALEVLQSVFVYEVPPFTNLRRLVKCTAKTEPQ